MGIVCNKDDTQSWHTAKPWSSQPAEGASDIFNDGNSNPDPYAAAPVPRKSGGYDPGRMVYQPPPRRNSNQRRMGDAGSHRSY